MNDLNVLALFKGQHRFIFIYDDVSREPMLDAVRHCAADPETSLNWFDAAVLAERAQSPAQVLPAPWPSHASDCTSEIATDNAIDIATNSGVSSPSDVFDHSERNENDDLDDSQDERSL